MNTTIVYKILKLWSHLFSSISIYCGMMTVAPSVETQHDASPLYFQSQAAL